VPSAPLLPHTRLEAAGITVRFRGLTAVSGVSLTLHRGTILGLIGPNGAGKTTLVNVLSGFQVPTAGTVALDGVTVGGWSPARFRRQGIARTFQSGRLFRDLTVAENAQVPAVNLGLGSRRAAMHALELLQWIGLADKADRPAGTLTYTDERRLGMARALACSPCFVLLDEPAAGMSDAECEEIMRVIAAIPEAFGCGVLLIEHNMRVLMGVSESVHVLSGGESIASGTPEEVRADPRVIGSYLGEAQTGQRPRQDSSHAPRHR
jgi:branched-chain amino acid transport system ATP-binding protein